MGVNETTLGDERHRCDACGEIRFTSELGECYVCQQAYDGETLRQRFCKTDCLTTCTGGDHRVCEHHTRQSGECISCSGPTDAEMHAAGMIAY